MTEQVQLAEAKWSISLRHLLLAVVFAATGAVAAEIIRNIAGAEKLTFSTAELVGFLLSVVLSAERPIDALEPLRRPTGAVPLGEMQLCPMTTSLRFGCTATPKSLSCCCPGHTDGYATPPSPNVASGVPPASKRTIVLAEPAGYDHPATTISPLDGTIARSSTPVFWEMVPGPP